MTTSFGYNGQHQASSQKKNLYKPVHTAQHRQFVWWDPIYIDTNISINLLAAELLF